MNALEFLRQKGTEILRENSKNKDAEMKFEYHFDTISHRNALTYERGRVSYATAFTEVLSLYGLDCEVLAPDRILIKKQSQK